MIMDIYCRFLSWLMDQWDNPTWVRAIEAIAIRTTPDNY